MTSTLIAQKQMRTYNFIISSLLIFVALYFCFLAIHYFIHPEVLVVGFAVGLFASIL